MELTNLDIFSAKIPLQKLMELQLPVRTSYQVAKLSLKLNEQLKVIDEVRNGLVKNYGHPDKNGQLRVEPDGEGFQLFIGEFNELMEERVDIKFDKVKLPENVSSTCDACHHNMVKAFEVEPSILMALDKFIEVV